AEQQRIREVQLQKREEERVQKNQLLQVLSALIIGRCQQTAMQRGEAGLLLLKYIAQKPRTGYSEQQLMLMFTRYCSYRDAGIPASIYRIGRESQMGPVGVSDVLKTLKLPTLCYGKRWQPTAAQQMAMRRGIRLGLPARDLVYFLRIPWYQAKAMRRQNGIARPVHDFTYRDLSAVYEAQDAGYGLSEISQLVRANTHRVQNVLQRRSALEPKVVQMLRDLYADSTISQPYVERRQASLASRAA
ncbi:MAG TPA: hypothetical protein VJK52_05965, partial [Candidatus Nanoarchaeia archaeon]|nr:hypothetical protein [Candidatus Nanoarchaeia archaeon]